MVARDFQKKISFLIKRLDAGDLTRVIVQWHRNHKRPVEEALGCVQEFYDYAGKLKQVVAQDPRSLSLHFWPLIETLVTHLQKGARETAKQRLLDNSTLKEKQSLWPELKEAGGGALSEKGKRKAEEEVYAAYGEPTKRAREGSHSGQEDEHADSRDDDEERAERDVDERTERDVDERTEHDVDERAEHDVNEHAEHHGADAGGAGSPRPVVSRPGRRLLAVGTRPRQPQQRLRPARPGALARCRAGGCPWPRAGLARARAGCACSNRLACPAPSSSAVLAGAGPADR